MLFFLKLNPYLKHAHLISSLDRIVTNTAIARETWNTLQIHDMHVGPLSHRDAPLNL